jgi:predicted CXXCH cytochrome family protein
MEGFDIPTDQLEEYYGSVHGVALLERQDTGAPACNDCHGNHGAVPPEVDVVANICGNCHVFNQQLFEASPLRVAFGVEKHPQCTVCHERHAIAKPTDDWLDWRGDSVCKKCHEDGHEAQHMATTFYNIIDSLKVNIVLADSLIERAEMRGMEVSDLHTAMEDAHRVLVQSRTAVHAFSEEHLRKTTNEGHKFAATSVAGALELLEQFGGRKRVLLIATAITLLLVLIIWLKIRQIEATKKS